MSPLSILLLALGLAMDATAVSAAKGLSVPRVLPRHVLLVVLFFGGFQALMPLIGWALGARLGPLVEAWTHWIAFALLVAIGGKMIFEARAPADEERAKPAGDPFSLKVMLLLAVATSIDDLAVGVAMPMLKAPLGATIVTIGVTTGAASALGLYAGRRFGALLGRRLDAFGGAVLVGLGVKILIERLA